MKTTSKMFPFLFTVAALALPARAQTLTNNPANPTPPPTEGTFFQSAVGYFTAFNTNLDSTFGANRGTVWTGVDSIQGQGATLANALGIAYDVWKPASSGSTSTASSATSPASAGSVSSPAVADPGGFAVSLESVTRNGGVQGTIISEGAGVGLSFVVHDVKLTAYADGNYYFADSSRKFGAEFGLRVFKALTAHTFAGVGIGMQTPGNRQILSAVVGFTF